MGRGWFWLRCELVAESCRRVILVHVTTSNLPSDPAILLRDQIRGQRCVSLLRGFEKGYLLGGLTAFRMNVHLVCSNEISPKCQT